MIRIAAISLLLSGASALLVKTGNTSSVDKGTTYIYAGDFSGGTYRITKSGKYALYQNVEFEPKGSEVTDTLFPKRTSTKYPQFGGYFLGFFAAMTVEAKDVEIDCKGHEIKMSEKFHKHQRFFAVIELGSKPFISGQGPPQFSSYITSPGAVVSADNVKISNCKLGRSAHHGIHGNNNNGVTIRDVKIYDFEVAGISLNGATKVEIDTADIGPSLANTFRAALSQAIFLDHLGNSLLSHHKDLLQYTTTTEVTLRGHTEKVSDVFKRLRTELRAFLAGGAAYNRTSYHFEGILGSGDELPDGSAMYGVMLHTTGAAVGDFGAGCANGEDPDEHLVGQPVVLKNIHIHDLKLNVDQVTRTIIGDGPQLMGPAGDVFTVTRVWNKDGFSYIGNTLADAQIAYGALKDAVSSWKAVVPITWEDAKYFFGATNIPKELQEWAAGKTSGYAFKNFLRKEAKMECQGDAMSHHNKGVAGVRLEFQQDVEITNMKIEGLINVGKEDASPYCRAPGYKGNDVRGFVSVHNKNVKKDGLEVASLNAPNGATIAMDMIQLEMRPAGTSDPQYPPTFF